MRDCRTVAAMVRVSPTVNGSESGRRGVGARDAGGGGNNVRVAGDQGDGRSRPVLATTVARRPSVEHCLCSCV